ncbi:HNH endonuclease family protein [Marinomonas sp. CT5]|uniref:HNH endonuclease family protein n=1 Tax=Marinomonas sp. CT5 TaxID=2066133 RepID=UPI001BB0C6A2|nr:HNH endonuclease family protein [Marinomonas sp. CT5]
MVTFFHSHILIVILLVLSASSQASEIVKKSKSAICHTPGSQYYSRTKNFTSYDTLDQCLASGGRLPKGQSYTSQSKPKVVSETPTKYSRDEFGRGWADEDKDCQNTRQEILISLSTAPVRFSDDRECRVTFGRWISMYSGEVIFDASKIDIDHIVPLKWAWDNGADKWSKEKREQFANDPVNLVAVEASLNRQKGAKGLDEWQPPKNQTQYKARYERVLKKYGIQITIR